MGYVTLHPYFCFGVRVSSLLMCNLDSGIDRGVCDGDRELCGGMYDLQVVSNVRGCLFIHWPKTNNILLLVC